MKVFLSRTLILFYVATLGTATSFYALLTAVPIRAMATGGGVGAGMATGALMLSTVAAEVLSPWLITRYGYRSVFAWGAVLLGLPALALSLSDSLAAILAVCLVRGLGFGLVVVVGSALVATLVPAERRGEGLGVYGIVFGVPSIVMLPLGVWLADRVGYDAVVVAGALAGLVGLVVLRIPRVPPAADASRQQPGRMGQWIRYAIAFATTAMACGIVVTFLPAVSDIVEVALLVQAATATLARWAAGRVGDKYGVSRLLIPGAVLSAAGMAALIMASDPFATLAGMALFGAGFGISQNASLTAMYQHAPMSSYGTVSAVWNFAYDAGIGAGAAGFGILVTATGFPLAFGITAAFMLAVTAAALVRRTGTAERSHPLSPARQS
ncbi:MAG TPA: MFS transporter [Candidatus Limnocylindrales bacterium]|nr:MFS transporter [Candidatus Limnocylindrales bacterium]